jgi:hypothetical protein
MATGWSQQRQDRRGWRADSRAALRTWLGGRILLIAVVVTVPVGLRWRGRPLHPAPWPLDRLSGWDTWHFTRIAERGYLPPGLKCCDQAFFPGYPLLIRAVMPLVAGSSLWAGLVVTLVCGVAAALALHRLTLATTSSPEIARRAVLYLALAPTGIFLTAVYTEAMFLALSVGAWLAGTRRRWWWAGLLAAGAATVRVNGLLLCASLAVMYAVQLRQDGTWRPRRDALALVLPVLATLAFVGYLAVRTGSLSAWQEAQQQGWLRRTAWPWVGLAAGWDALWQPVPGFLLLSRIGDLVAVLAGTLLTLALVRLRRWPEASYLLLNVAVLVCSTLIVSAPRYALMWFPGYIVLAEYAARPRLRWLRLAVPALCVPLLLLFSLLFAAHRWVA